MVHTTVSIWARTPARHVLSYLFSTVLIVSRAEKLRWWVPGRVSRDTQYSSRFVSDSQQNECIVASSSGFNNNLPTSCSNFDSSRYGVQSPTRLESSRCIQFVIKIQLRKRGYL